MKARPVAAAAGAILEEPSPAAGAPAGIPDALAAGRERPEPGAGVFETVRVMF